MQCRILLLVSIITVANTAPKKFSPIDLPDDVPMAWIDGRNRKLDPGETPEIDTFYDKVAYIGIYNYDTYYVHSTIGIYITYYRVLTSFNAFRRHSRDPVVRRLYKVISIEERVLNKYPEISYKLLTKPIIYGRQVLPFQDEGVPIDMRHGPHLPHNDLMVLRIEGTIPVPPSEPIPITEFSRGPPVKSGLSLGKIAGLDHESLDNLKYVSLGHISDEHIQRARFLEKEDVDSKDDVILDCDEWIPREWGRFICLLNVNNYPAIATGALLFSDNIVVGVGAFAIWREGKSALMFTDVRPYKTLIMKACTTEDQNLVLPNPEL